MWCEHARIKGSAPKAAKNECSTVNIFCRESVGLRPCCQTVRPCLCWLRRAGVCFRIFQRLLSAAGGTDFPEAPGVRVHIRGRASFHRILAQGGGFRTRPWSRIFCCQSPMTPCGKPSPCSSGTRKHPSWHRTQKHIPFFPIPGSLHYVLFGLLPHRGGGDGYSHGHFDHKLTTCKPRDGESFPAHRRRSRFCERRMSDDFSLSLANFPPAVVGSHCLSRAHPARRSCSLQDQGTDRQEARSTHHHPAAMILGLPDFAQSYRCDS